MVKKFAGGALSRAAVGGGTDEHLVHRILALVVDYEKEMEIFGFHKALSSAFEVISLLNKYIDTEAPWKLAKENVSRLQTVLYNLWNGVRIATVLLHPFMPQKTEEIWKAIGFGTPLCAASADRERTFYHTEALAPIEKVPPLFPRIEK